MIEVERLGKRFSRYHAGRPTTLMEAALLGWRRLRPKEYFWALRDVCFTVASGRIVGVIGGNGAGKSTLLLLIGGVGRPDEGRVRVKGRIGALLDLGSGLHSDLTGRENVFISAVVAGLTRREIRRRFDEIVEFAELEEFVDNPVRTYSTGMQMRLAFSIAIHTEPQALLIDELLSVGDLAFQSKCLERVSRLRSQGCAIVYVSHNVEQIQKLCDDVLWLRKGQVAAHGDAQAVVREYMAEMRSKTQQLTPTSAARSAKSGIELRANENRFGSLEVEITDVLLSPPTSIHCGDALSVAIEYLARRPAHAAVFGVTISAEDGRICFEASTEGLGGTLQIEGAEGGRVILHVDRLDLNEGAYFVDVGIYQGNWEYAYDYHWHVYPLLISSSTKVKGIICPPHRWEYRALGKPSSAVRR